MNYETDIAVLQVEVRNLSEKVDEHTKTTQQMLREYHAENNRQHNELFTRIVKLEHWREVVTFRPRACTKRKNYKLKHV